MVVARRRGLIVIAALTALTGLGADRSLSESRTVTHRTGRAAGGTICDGLLAFASNRAQDAYSEIYSISLDGHRTDVSRTIGSDSYPQPSPDGTKLAFWTDGHLVVAHADGSHPSAIPAPGGSFYASRTAEWSPDSRRLAVTVDAISSVNSASLVAVLDIGTGAWTTLGFGSDPHWSPTGSNIAFVGDGARGAQSVFVSGPDGSGMRLVALGTAPVWSPDGTRLLVGSSVVPIDGAAPIPIGLFGLAWTPDGSRILGTAVGSALASVAADGTDSRVIAADVTVGSREVISPDGRRLVFERSDRHVVVTDLDGHLVSDFGPLPPPPMTFWDPRWSPDSSKILLWSGGNVIVGDVNSPKTWTPAGGAHESTDQPVWSADGSSVLDAISDATGNTDIYVARPGGSGVRAVYADRLPEGGPVWSPDGRRLAFIRYGSRPSLVVTDLRGHARVLATLPRDRRFPVQSLMADGPLPSPPAWSPDGKAIAVAASKGVELVDVRTHTVQPSSRPSGEGVPVAVAWSRQGVIATTDGLDESSIWLTGKQGTRAIAIYDFYEPDYGDVAGLATSLTWSPDGRKLAYLRYGAEVGTGFFEWVTESTQIVDTSSRKTRSVPVYSWDFNWSPDGRHFIQGGFNVEVTTIGGKEVARLPALRALDPSWQPLCRSGRAR